MYTRRVNEFFEKINKYETKGLQYIIISFYALAYCSWFFFLFAFTSFEMVIFLMFWILGEKWELD